MILTDVQRWGFPPTLLDIGCGRGFDDSHRLQASLAIHAGRYIGVEPATVSLQGYFDEVHRCHLEEAPIAPESIDLAFAVMVLEHLREPQSFFDKLHTVLAAGGIFWGFTMDARHWFCTASLAAKRFGIKTAYLNLVWGRSGQDRYENHPAYYRANTPDRIRFLAHAFHEVRCLNFAREGQLDPYLPRPLRLLGRLLDRRAMARHRPGPILAVRLEK